MKVSGSFSGFLFPFFFTLAAAGLCRGPAPGLLKAFTSSFRRAFLTGIGLAPLASASKESTLELLSSCVGGMSISRMSCVFTEEGAGETGSGTFAFFLGAEPDVGSTAFLFSMRASCLTASNFSTWKVVTFEQAPANLLSSLPILLAWLQITKVHSAKLWGSIAIPETWNISLMTGNCFKTSW